MIAEGGSAVEAFDERLAAALAMHRAGRLDQAGLAYERLLSERPDSADVIGLVAMLRHQRGDSEGAKTLWRRSLSLPASPWIHVRDLNNLLATLIEEGDADAGALADAHPIDLATAPVPDERQCDQCASLLDALATLERIGPARRLAEQAIALAPGDVRLLELAGRLRLEAGEAEAAWPVLNEAARLAGDRADPVLLSALSACAERLNRHGDARLWGGRACAAAPVYMAEARPGQEGLVLVLNATTSAFQKAVTAETMHLSKNYPAQFARQFGDQFRFASVLADDDRARELAIARLKPDLVINNQANPELLSAERMVAPLSALIDRLGAPVINHPAVAAPLTRQHLAEVLADEPDVVAPPIFRFERNRGDAEALARSVELVCAYPLILRTVFFQESVGMHLVSSRQEFRDRVAENPDPQIYVQPFRDHRPTRGFHRKMRAAVIDGEVFLLRVDYDTDWCVHGRRATPERHAFYLANPDLLAEEARICADPAGVLGPRAMAGLEAIRRHVPLDLFGIDFDVLDDGRILFFEANATMVLLSNAAADVNYPRDAEERFRAAVVAAFRRRIARARTRPTVH